MANLKELKTRISSVKSTQKITSAMKMVAASRLRRAQEALRLGDSVATGDGVEPQAGLFQRLETWLVGALRERRRMK